MNVILEMSLQNRKFVIPTTQFLDPVVLPIISIRPWRRQETHSLSVVNIRFNIGFTITMIGASLKHASCRSIPWKFENMLCIFQQLPWKISRGVCIKWWSNLWHGNFCTYSHLFEIFSCHINLFNPLAPRTCGSDFENLVFKPIMPDKS